MTHVVFQTLLLFYLQTFLVAMNHLMEWQVTQAEKKIHVVVTNLTQSNGEIVVLGHLTEGMD
jgi:hypothetical protein